MNRTIEKIYYRSPLFLQNIAVSAYGARLLHRRHGGQFSRYVSRLRDSESASRETLRQLQAKLLRTLLEHAFKNVPFYRDFARAHRLAAEDFSALSDLGELPIVEKEQLRESPDLFKADKSSIKGDIFELHTSGTSGTPLTIYCNADSERRHYAFMRRMREWFGINPRMRRATFYGRIMVSPSQSEPPFWRYDLFQNNCLFSSYHMSDANLKHYYEKLLSFRPDELIGYPSSLFLLAKFQKKNGLGGIRPRAVFTTAETLLEHQRDIIEEVFQRPVVDHYSSTEMAFFISQCEHGTYHLHPEHGMVEVVNSKGGTVPAGEEGEAVATGFTNYAMPVIRYRIGDRIALGEGECACSRSFPIVNKIVGRVDDILITPDGRPLGRLDPVFKGMSGIFETQIVQDRTDRLLFRMAVDANFSKEDMKTLLYEIRKRTGPDMTIDFEIVDEIPKDRNGKFRSVITTVAEQS
jgi:phenylacetate-CoA ligase